MRPAKLVLILAVAAVLPSAPAVAAGPHLHWFKQGQCTRYAYQKRPDIYLQSVNGDRERGTQTGDQHTGDGRAGRRRAEQQGRLVRCRHSAERAAIVSDVHGRVLTIVHQNVLLAGEGPVHSTSRRLFCDHH